MILCRTPLLQWSNCQVHNQHRCEGFSEKCNSIFRLFPAEPNLGNQFLFKWLSSSNSYLKKKANECQIINDNNFLMNSIKLILLKSQLWMTLIDRYLKTEIKQMCSISPSSWCSQTISNACVNNLWMRFIHQWWITTSELCRYVMLVGCLVGVFALLWLDCSSINALRSRA